MPSKLDEIVHSTRRHLLETKSQARLHELEKLCTQHRPRGFSKALEARSASAPAIIAELKKASPSKGVIRADFDPAALARELEAAGAAALSVLTDQPYFQGSLRNLQLASAAVTLPCLRKDFIVDPFQIAEARAHHADAILLIVAALTDHELRSLHTEARLFGLDVLREAHNRDELRRAADLGFDLIGINNRDLKILSVDPENSLRFLDDFPPHALRVAESGIDSPATLQRLRAAGYHAFLIGERLMRASHPGEALKELLA